MSSFLDCVRSNSWSELDSNIDGFVNVLSLSSMYAPTETEVKLELAKGNEQIYEFCRAWIIATNRLYDAGRTDARNEYGAFICHKIYREFTDAEVWTPDENGNYSDKDAIIETTVFRLHRTLHQDMTSFVLHVFFVCLEEREITEEQKLLLRTIPLAVCRESALAYLTRR